MYSLKSCLSVTHNRDSASVLLRQFAAEACKLLWCIRNLKHEAYVAVVQGTMYKASSVAPEVDAAFFDKLVVRSLLHWAPPALRTRGNIQ